MARLSKRHGNARRSGFSRDRRDRRDHDHRNWLAAAGAAVAAMAAARSRLKPLLQAAAGLAALGALAWGAMLALDRPIRQVIVQGPFERVSVLQIEAAVGDLRGVGFLGVRLDPLRERIVAIDWVDDAVVRRRWPAEVEVVVVEQVPAARWGESGLLNTRGDLFVRDARHVPPELPRLAGPAGSEKLVARRYLDARATLTGIGLGLSRLEMDERGSWRIQLSNGVELRLGREAFDARLRRFARIAAPLLAARVDEVGHVDLRYSRGFAVGWRPAAPQGRTTRKGQSIDG